MEMVPVPVRMDQYRTVQVIASFRPNIQYRYTGRIDKMQGTSLTNLFIIPVTSTGTRYIAHKFIYHTGNQHRYRCR
jgi:hypothetical protein